MRDPANTWLVAISKKVCSDFCTILLDSFYETATKSTLFAKLTSGNEEIKLTLKDIPTYLQRQCYKSGEYDSDVVDLI